MGAFRKKEDQSCPLKTGASCSKWEIWNICQLLYQHHKVGFIVMESGTWSSNQRMQYKSMMLYHNKNSDQRSSKKNISITNKKQPQGHHDCKSTNTTDT